MRKPPKTLTMINAPKAWGDVLAERQRQIRTKGWTRISHELGGLIGQKWAAVLRSTALDMPELPEFQGSASFEADTEARAFVGAVA